ncbi:MtnX-like HAD-IB family phosphatase [Chloroflexota bacterium]
MTEKTKTLVQCDFDGTITEQDASFLLLDTFTKENWRALLKEYTEGRITVGHFNTKAFAMIKADREALLKVIKEKTVIRPGVPELADFCDKKGFRLVIVSNGLDFYIEELVKDIGVADIEIFAARTRFNPEGLKVQYIGPDGNPLDDDFKESYVDLFLKEDYRIIYIGNGTSDFAPARKCNHIFAIDSLLSQCQKNKVACTPFSNLNDVVRTMESWE